VTMALSRISTENGAAMDTFYVTDSANRSKITDANRINLLQSELHAAVLRNSERS
jgi:UTP:GlnB (protein PII) uridylyltransferase